MLRPRWRPAHRSGAIQPRPFGQPHQPSVGPVDELGVGRDHHVLRLHGRVHGHLARVGRLHRPGLDRNAEASLQKRDDPLLAPCGCARASSTSGRSISDPFLHRVRSRFYNLSRASWCLQRQDPYEALREHLKATRVGVLKGVSPSQCWQANKRRNRPPPSHLVRCGQWIVHKVPFYRDPLD